VTLCDPMWHVSSRSGLATLRTAIHLLLTYLLTYYGRGSVLLWQRCDTLCTSVFMDDVMFADKLRQLNVATQLMEAQPRTWL